MDTKTTAEIAALKNEIKELREVTKLLLAGVRLALRGLSFLACGVGVKGLLKVAAAEGLVKFDTKIARDNDEEALADYQEDVNKDFKRNEVLYNFQRSFIEKETVVKSPGGGSPGASRRETQGPEIC